MKLIWLLLLLPLAASAGVTSLGSGGAAPSAAAACTPQCDPQTFTLDPYNGPSGWPWTPFGTAGLCPVQWDSANGRLERNVTHSTSCDHTNAGARFNGDIARDSCAKYQIVSSNDGTGNHDTGFEFGFMMRHQSGSPNPGANQAPSNQGAYVVRSETGLNGDFLRLSSVFNLAEFALTCTDFGAVSELGWIGACIYGTGYDTVVSVYNFGASDPGNPTNAAGGGWDAIAAANAEPAANVCTFNAAFAAPNNVCVSGTSLLCDDYGTAWGIWMRSNDVTAGGSYKVDNFQTYSCQP